MKPFIKSLLYLFISTCLVASIQADVLVTYYHNDLLGSPVAATDENGNLLWQEEYMPFGERVEKDPKSKNNRQWHTGKPLDDATGLTYLGARYCDSKIGRFMAVDPVGFSSDNIHSFNRYALVINNPYKYVDPNGEDSRDAVREVLGDGELPGESVGNAFEKFGEGAATSADVVDGVVSDPINLVPGGGILKILGIGAVGLKAGIKFASRDEARKALGGDLGKAANRFFKGASKTKSKDFTITDLPDGGKRFEFFTPAKNEGFGKRFIQDVDSNGKIVREFKDTISPDGNVIERKFIHGGQ